MKKCIISLMFAILFIVPSHSQVFCGLNNTMNFGLGYSYLYNNDSELEPKDLVEVDLNFYGVYAAFSYGYNTLYSEVYHFDKMYTEELNTYCWKVGPSLKIYNLNTNNGLIITPYLGMITHSYSESNTYKTHYCYDYHCYESSYSICKYEDTYKHYFIYGVKVSATISIVEFGAHISNKEVGVNVGFCF